MSDLFNIKYKIIYFDILAIKNHWLFIITSIIKKIGKKKIIFQALQNLI